MPSISSSVSVRETLGGQADEAVRVLRNGGVAAIPTDTVYGLAAAYDDVRRLSPESLASRAGRPGLAVPLLLDDAGSSRALRLGCPRVVLGTCQDVLARALDDSLEEESPRFRQAYCGQRYRRTSSARSLAAKIYLEVTRQSNNGHERERERQSVADDSASGK